MRDEFVLCHAERAGHPAEEAEVGAEVEVDEPPDGGARVVVGRRALAGEVELGEVNAVVDGLDAEHGEEDEEDQRAEDVDEGRHAQVLQRRHGEMELVLVLASTPGQQQQAGPRGRKEGGRPRE